MADIAHRDDERDRWHADVRREIRRWNLTLTYIAAVLTLVLIVEALEAAAARLL